MKRVLVAILVFLALVGIAVILPPALPGQLPAGQMTGHDGPPCSACPPTEQLATIGMTAGENGWFVNVRFVAPPFNSGVRLFFDGVSGNLSLHQTGSAWSVDPGGAGIPAATSVAQRDELVVVGLPAPLRANGVAASTPSGDRIPSTTFVAPHYPPPPHFNSTDMVLLLILMITAWYGFRRGLIGEVANLLAILLSFVTAAMAYKPLAAYFSRLTRSPLAGSAIGSGAVMVVVGIAASIVLPTMLSRLHKALPSLGSWVDRALASALASMRQLVVLAMIVTVGLDTAVLYWAAPGIKSSLLGSALLRSWRSVFTTP